MKKIIFAVIFALTLFYLSHIKDYTKAQTEENITETSWFVLPLQNESDYNSDGIPDVLTFITPINNTFLEIFVKQTNLEKGKKGYKWASALCNITGVQEVGKWEYNPATDVWTYTGLLNYDKLTNYGLSGTWCNETNNYGFILFGSGSGDKRYRLNFTEGHKVIQIHTGKGSELKEAMTSKKYYDALSVFTQKINRILEKRKNAYENGTELYLLDLNQTILVRTDGVVSVIQEIDSRNMTGLSLFTVVGWKFACFNFAIDGETKTYCPENKTTHHKIREELIREELRHYPRETNFSYFIRYLLVDNKTGNLINFSTEFKEEKEIHKQVKLNPLSVFNIENLRTKRQINVNFTFNGTSHCIRFPVTQHANVTYNITMPSRIANYTFGREEFIIENYTVNNTVIAKIRVYPCCNITGVGLQTAEVCSE